ncbi:uncharacterized protein LOC118203813, partial [Stegodyphus dumicola]|uniref:uncharacterized protein LOC118203813 n=1 Tax=Stegodyphus dumicola TaxID=202533 RepID=UPI0015AAF804
MKALKALGFAMIFAATCGSNGFAGLSGNTKELLKQSPLEQFLEFQDVEQEIMMLQNSTRDNCDCGPKGKGCEYVKGSRKCICEKDYVDYKGVCQRCSCKIPDQICILNWSERYCRCPNGYAEKYERCA